MPLFSFSKTSSHVKRERRRWIGFYRCCGFTFDDSWVPDKHIMGLVFAHHVMIYHSRVGLFSCASFGRDPNEVLMIHYGAKIDVSRMGQWHTLKVPNKPASFSQTYSVESRDKQSPILHGYMSCTYTYVIYTYVMYVCTYVICIYMLYIYMLCMYVYICYVCMCIIALEN